MVDGSADLPFEPHGGDVQIGKKSKKDGLGSRRQDG